MPSEKKITGYELAVKLRKTRRRHPLTSTEQALFYELVAICNEMDWEDVFVCSNDELCHVLCISRNTLVTARMALINAGLIYFASGKSRRQFSSYSFVKSFSNSEAEQRSTHSNFDRVAQKSPPSLPSTTSDFDVDTGTDTGIDAGGDTGTNAAHYIQTETERKTKPTYDSIESLAGERFSQSDLPTEERKKSSAQKKKEPGTGDVTPHWNAMRQLWMKFYGDRHNGTEPTFGAEAGRAMKSILKRLQEHTARLSSEGEHSWTEPYAAKVFTHFLTLAYRDEWLCRHFRISNLSSHYDTIIQINSYEQQQSAKAGRKSDPTNVNSELKRRVYARLQGLDGEV